ncbi:MAG: hypothetical protein KGJ57_17225 [Sphingomonadales bacterium]|nr:hypothetical protein [Sphingomonadales bacterium]MDE2171142.1 hypothetical protein [Sphingomonadales bacterium]
MPLPSREILHGNPCSSWLSKFARKERISGTALCDLDRIRRDSKLIKVQRGQVRRKGLCAGKALVGVAGKGLNLACGHVHLAHPGKGVVVDDMVAASGLEQAQKSAAGFGKAAAEHRKPPIADVRDIAIASGMRGAGIVGAHHRHRLPPLPHRRCIQGYLCRQPDRG